MKPKHYYYTPAYCGLRCLNITLHVLLLVSIVTYSQHSLSIARCLLEHGKQQQVTRLKLDTYTCKLFVSESYLNNVRFESYTVGISFLYCVFHGHLLCSVNVVTFTPDQSTCTLVTRITMIYTTSYLDYIIKYKVFRKR